MSNRIFTAEQVDELRKNPNVSSCSDRSMTYAVAFKVLAVTLCEQGSMASEIFRGAGFDLSVVGKDQPQRCLGRWRKLFRTKGEDGLSEQRGKNNRGGRPRIRGVTEGDRIQKLEAEVAYLKLENAFLAKLRAKRAESNSGRGRNIPS
jgi:hypothetical protein